MFTKNNTHTNIVKGNITFCDSSSRTESLRRKTGLFKQPVTGKPLKEFDRNNLKHTIYSMRNSGGIPKKCSLSLSK